MPILNGCLGALVCVNGAQSGVTDRGVVQRLADVIPRP